MSKLTQQFDELLNSGSSVEKKGWIIGKNANTSDARGDITTAAVRLIIEQAVRETASDIHIEPYKKTIRIRYRVDGQLYEALRIEDTEKINIIPCIKVMSNLEIDSMAKRKSQDGRFSAKFGASNFDFRVATFPTVEGEKLVIRVLQESATLHNLEAISLSINDQNRINKMLSRKNGLLLVCGPTGSGKTTTLYAMLNKLNAVESNIVTLENPVEYKIPGMNQCDIKEKSNFSFADGLKAVLRQDPDIILVGEVRDRETADIATRAAITGHLVFSSIHANSAIGTIVRLINMGVDPVLVSYAMIGAIAQRLVRRICDECKEPYTVTSEQLSQLKGAYGIDLNALMGGKRASPTESSDEVGIQYIGSSDPYEGESMPDLILHKGRGCEFCNGQGYKGRIGIFEMIVFNQEMRDAILRNASSKELQDVAINNGTRLLAMDGLEKLKTGLTTLDEIYPLLIET